MVMVSMQSKVFTDLRSSLLAQPLTFYTWDYTHTFSPFSPERCVTNHVGISTKGLSGQELNQTSFFFL